MNANDTIHITMTRGAAKQLMNTLIYAESLVSNREDKTALKHGEWLRWIESRTRRAWEEARPND